MRTLLLDPMSGIAGDMFSAALLNTAVDFTQYWKIIHNLPLENYEISLEQTMVGSISCSHFKVSYSEKQPHRHLRHVNEIIDKANLPGKVAQNAKKIFHNLAEAEAKVHNSTPEKIHFHEVGAVDAIIDIISACLLIHFLEIDTVLCNPIALGGGTVKTAHGILPVPAPATAILLENFPTFTGPVQKELSTPTGAAILKTFVKNHSIETHGRIIKTGYGAGTLRFKNHLNLLPARIFESAEKSEYEYDSVSVIETTIDDMPGEWLTYLFPKLFAAGALDVICLPCTMKKSRQGLRLEVICPPETQEHLTKIIFAETPTFGIRYRQEKRIKLPRRFEVIKTEYGDVNIKVGEVNGMLIQASPEFADCAKLAEKHNVPFNTIYQSALKIFHN